MCDSFKFKKRRKLIFGGNNESLSVVAMRLGNEQSSSVAVRQKGRLLEHPEDFEDNNDNDNYSDYVENVSVHAGDSYQKWCAVTSIYPN